MIFEIAVKCEQCKQKQSSIMGEYYYLQLGLALQHYCTKLSFSILHVYVVQKWKGMVLLKLDIHVHIDFFWKDEN